MMWLCLQLRAVKVSCLGCGKAASGPGNAIIVPIPASSSPIESQVLPLLR